MFFVFSAKLEHYRTLENAFQHLTKSEQTLTEEKSRFKIKILDLEQEVKNTFLEIIFPLLLHFTDRNSHSDWPI